MIPGMQLRYFSKYVSNSRAKRIPLNTKRAGKGYNKGNGARKEGYVNSKGAGFAFYDTFISPFHNFFFCNRKFCS